MGSPQIVLLSHTECDFLIGKRRSDFNSLADNIIKVSANIKNGLVWQLGHTFFILKILMFKFGFRPEKLVDFQEQAPGYLQFL